MVSDIVLLKELPDFVKGSIETYVGCVSGAIKKGEYLASIETAGFQDVRVIEEASAKWVADDPAARAFIEQLGIPPEEVKELASSVISMKVAGVKGR
jgi:hypothetical protein